MIEPATSTLEPEVSIDLSRMLSNRGRVSGFRIVEAREAHRLPHLDVAAFRRVFTLLKQAAGLQVRIFQYFADFIGMNGGHMSFFQEPEPFVGGLLGEVLPRLPRTSVSYSCAGSPCR